MISGIVYFDEIIEDVKDATGIENMRPLYDKIKRFVFKVEKDIGGGGLIIRKKKSYKIGDGYYDGTTIIMPDDFVGEFSYGALSVGNLVGKQLKLYAKGPDEIDLRYMGFLLDENGNPFTTANHLEAVTAYTVYRLYSNKYFLKQGSQNQYLLYKREYEDAILNSRGLDAWPTEEDWIKIGRTMNGGMFEAMTDCGMKGFPTGDTDPMYVNIAPSEETCLFTISILGISNGKSIIEATISYKVKTQIQGVSDGKTMLYGNIWDKDTMIGISDGVSSWNDATLTSPTEPTGTIVHISGTADGSSSSNPVFAVKGILIGRSAGQVYISATINVKAVEYWYEGIIEFPNEVSGSATYIDQFGIQRTISNVYAPEVINFWARSIISINNLVVHIPL